MQQIEVLVTEYKEKQARQSLAQEQTVKPVKKSPILDEKPPVAAQVQPVIKPVKKSPIMDNAIDPAGRMAPAAIPKPMPVKPVQPPVVQ